jgi:hypothetical protein
MQFALVGDDPDGLAMAGALAATGRHQLALVCGVRAPGFAAQAQREDDLEEILADPKVEMIIVAGPLPVRADQLRRAVQSERHALCVYPCADKPDAAYEMALIRDDTRKALVPLLPWSLHPAVERFRELASGFRLLTCEHHATGVAGIRWDVLRAIGGEIAEVTGFAADEKWDPAKPYSLQGRFEKSGLLQFSSLPNSPGSLIQLAATGRDFEARLSGTSFEGAVTIARRSAGGEWSEERFAAWDAWPALVAIVEAACAEPLAPSRVSWQEAIHGLELDDALKRSIEKRRAQSLEYREVNEEISTRGTLTLIGCGMIWLILLIFGLSIWIPWLRWAVVPLLAGFLLLLGMKWLAQKSAS